MFEDFQVDEIPYAINIFWIPEGEKKESALEERYGFWTMINETKYVFKAEYNPQLYRDLCGIYGLDPGEELMNILKAEFENEIRIQLKPK